VVIEEQGARIEMREQNGVHVHAWSGRPTVKAAERYYAALGAIVDRSRPFVLLTETAGANVPSAQVRQRIGELQAELEPRMRPFSIGNVVVVRNTLLRGALTALTWLAPSLSEIVYADSLEEGLRVADEMVDSHRRGAAPE